MAQNRGLEDVNNQIKKCSMKVTFRKRNKKKPFIYSDYLLKNICQEDQKKAHAWIEEDVPLLALEKSEIP